VTHEISSVWQYIDKVVLLGYNGKFLIRAPQKVIETALLTGLGERNS